MQNSPTPQQLFLNLIDRKQLAQKLGVSPSFISKLMVEQGLPHIKLGRAVRYDLREVMAFLNERKFP
jgi:excisionase family DNA binding protein